MEKIRKEIRACLKEAFLAECLKFKHVLKPFSVYRVIMHYDPVNIYKKNISMNFRFLLSLVFVFFFVGLLQAQEKIEDKSEKPKSERPNKRPDGQRPSGGGRGEMTPEQWRMFSEKMPKIGKVYGKIIESQSGKPVEYATVALLLQMDSSIVSGVVTDGKGNFSMEELPVGRFIVMAEFMGYDTYYSEMIGINPRKQAEHNLGNISLEIKSESLNEVVVEEKRPFMELELDKKVFNVSDNITVSGGTATEVLEQIPSVDVDIDGNVSLRGSQNLRILIDGRPTALAGGDPAAILEQIPSETIDRVEVITAPSAKYDPDGMVGILNIILKKNRKIGLTGLVSTNWGVIDADEYGVNGSIGYKNKKVNITAGYGYRNNERDRLRENYRINTLADTTFSFIQEGTGASRRKNHNVNLGLEVYPTSNSSISTSARLRFNDGNSVSENIYNNYDENITFTDVQRILENENESGTNKNFSLGYQNRFKGDWNHVLNMDLSYSDDFETEINTFDQADYTISDQGFASPVDNYIYNQEDITDNMSQVVQASVDYEKPFKNEAKVEVGYKSIFRFTDGDFNSSIDALDNRFLFDEQIHSVYSTFAYPVTSSFSIKGGLRLEQAITDSELVNTGETFDRNYFSWFPSLSLSQQLKNDMGSLSLSYSRRINRPRIRQVNPFVNYSDPLNFRQGNPNLAPEYTNAVELNYMKRWDKVTLTPSIFYRYTTGIINRFKTVDNEGISTTSYVNLNSAHAYGVEMVAVYSPFKWWRIMPSVNLSQTILNPGNIDADLNASAISVGGRLMSNMSFKKDFDIQLFLFYRAPRNLPQGSMKSIFFATIGVKKKVLDGKGSIGLNIRDPFSTGIFRFTTEGDTFYQDGLRQREPYVVTLSFSYRFGKQERNRRGGRGGDRDGGETGGFDDMMD
jgi:outer membrane receptor protein involved in Fe transport